jgi:indolepyruvate ferredoxin oxidoreductase
MASPTTAQLPEVHIDDKYVLDEGRIFVTGIQALVRLPMLQHTRDKLAGLHTAGFISGYRGSPLGALDQQLRRAEEFLDPHDITFVPGVNEDLAATSLWGTQQAELGGEGRYDGVFGMWYGKGPGVDRSGDALRHANLAGTSPNGGVVALLGDDHACESSTTANQSEYAMVDAMIPVLNPAGVQDILDYGLYGWALSRFSGCWTALKCVHDTVEATASVQVSPERARAIVPQDYPLPPGGLNIRWPGCALRHHHHGQILPRRARGAGGTRHRCRRSETSGYTAVQSRDAVAAGTARCARILPRPAARRGSGRKTRTDRGATQEHPVQRHAAPAGSR